MADSDRKAFATGAVTGHSRVMQAGERIDEILSWPVIEGLVKRGLARIEEAVKPKQKAKAAEPKADEPPADAPAAE